MSSVQSLEYFGSEGRSTCGSGSENTAQIGVVTFGYGEPVYAAPLTDDPQNVYLNYLNADLPDGTATDLATALEYTSGLFKNPEVAKIVVISDGMETDGKCANVVRELAARGIEVNAVYFPGERPTQEYQVEGPEGDLFT